MKSLEQLKLEYDEIDLQLKKVKHRTIGFGSCVLVMVSLVLLKIILITF